MTHPKEPDVHKGPLPDLFLPPGGTRVASPEDWPEAAQRWRSIIVDTLFGGMPAAPEAVEVETLCHSVIRRLPGLPRNLSYRIHCHHGGRSFSFCVRILTPGTNGPHPAVINGDGCWWYITDEIVQAVLASGCALVLFNRTEMAEDVGSTTDTWRSGVLPRGHVFDNKPGLRREGLYDFSNHTGFGAISAWAWGYHRCVDVLYQLPYIDPTRIAVTGHSRGAKATLLAGLTDERITLINDNASCAAGSPLFRYVGNGGETLGEIQRRFPSWFSRQLGDFAGKEETLPFDQHCLLAALAPRPVLLTFASDDRWSNPEGMVVSVEAARPVYQLLGQPDNLAFHLRDGDHTHSLSDWNTLMAFVRGKWRGEKPGVAFNQHPYEHLPSVEEVSKMASAAS
jgi:hypothetical protein